MGSCLYFLKAQFKTAKEAKKALKGFNAFLKENWDACELQVEPSKVKFPLTREYLKITEGTWDDVPSYSYSTETKAFIYFDNIFAYAAEVSHLSSWEQLAEYVQKKFNPLRVAWDNEENGVNSLEGLNLYAWEDIVDGILKKKETLPLLMGIHPDLDELIAFKLKE
jgi:hypothetical protein